MSAADKREELEAAIHRMLTDIRQEGIEDAAMYIGTRLDIPHLAKHLTGNPARRQGTAMAILAASDAYAEAVADERIAGHVHERIVGRERISALADSIGGRR